MASALIESVPIEHHVRSFGEQFLKHLEEVGHEPVPPVIPN